VVNSYRIVVSDTEIAGVRLKAGDWIFNTLPLANLDPAAFDDPLKVDIDRPGNRHMGLSFGPHFCLGAHLAKRELAIAWEELLARLPPFRAHEERTQIIAGPTLLGVHHLELVW
jgi:cytochrome P450